MLIFKIFLSPVSTKFVNPPCPEVESDCPMTMEYDPVFSHRALKHSLNPDGPLLLAFICQGRDPEQVMAD